MIKTSAIFSKDFTVAKTDDRLFGTFLEHGGRAVYGGVYEPSHSSSDEEGFRQDVIDYVKELDYSVVRYPGGNFVSGYDWTDGIGPVEERPIQMELAWLSLETNQFGLDEFMSWCKKASVSPMITVNLGTKGPQEAKSMVEYCNFKGGSKWSDLRIKNGAKQPHDVKLWCLGNEMDGPWQICAKDGVEYGKIARETAKMMKWVDPSIELVLCGSTYYDKVDFCWGAQALEQAYEYVDYISLHIYSQDLENDAKSFLASNLKVDEYIETVIATADYVKAKVKSNKKINLSFDEWNVWFHTIENDTKRENWKISQPILEDIYTCEDAVVVGLMLISLLRHADRVKIACLAQMVNVIAPIMTRKGGSVWKQTIFYPFLHASKYGRGEVLRGIINTPKYDCRKFKDVPYLDSVCVYNEEASEVTIFAVNRSSEQSMEFRCKLRDFGKVELIEQIEMFNENMFTTNTEDHPYACIPVISNRCIMEDGNLTTELNAVSWNVIRVKILD